MKKQEKCVEAVLEKAIIVTYEVEEGSFFSSSAVGKLAWALEFDNGMRVICKNEVVEVGAKHKIKYTVWEDGTITGLSVIQLTEEKDES